MRDKICPLHSYCNNFKKTKSGSCSSKLEDILDCYNDIEENKFRLKNLMHSD